MLSTKKVEHRVKQCKYQSIIIHVTSTLKPRRAIMVRFVIGLNVLIVVVGLRCFILDVAV